MPPIGHLCSALVFPVICSGTLGRGFQVKMLSRSLREAALQKPCNRHLTHQGGMWSTFRRVTPLCGLAMSCRVIVICGLLDRWHRVPARDLNAIIPGVKTEGVQPTKTTASGLWGTTLRIRWSSARSCRLDLRATLSFANSAWPPPPSKVPPTLQRSLKQ